MIDALLFKDYLSLCCIDSVFLLTDFLVVTASVVVLSVGSNGQVFATSAIRYVLGV